MEWTKGDCNEWLEGDGFHVSYNPNPNADPLGKLMNLIGASVGLETKGAETALVLHQGQPKYRVLTGDFRKEYEAAVPLGLDACIAVYDRNKAQHRSDWSQDDVASPEDVAN